MDLAQQRQHQSNALADLGITPGAIEDEELDKLWDAGYRTLDRLQVATREGLTAAKLLPGTVDFILSFKVAPVTGAGLVQSSAQGAYMAQLTSVLQTAPSKVKAKELQRDERGPVFKSWRPSLVQAAGLPAALQHPAFAHFKAAVKNGPATAEDLQVAFKLCTIAADFYDVEDELREGVNSLFPSYLRVGPRLSDTSRFTRVVKKHKLQPDWLISDGPDSTWLVLLAETKNGLLGSAATDPNVQGGNYYAHFWHSRLTGGDGKPIAKSVAIFNTTCCPALLVEVLGPHMRVSALAWLDRITIYPLTPLVNLLWLDDDPDHLEALGRILRALKGAVHELQAFYSALELSDAAVLQDGRAPGLDLALPYPLHSQQYKGVESLLNDYRLLYRAVDASSNQQVVIKFVPYYGAEVHRQWEALGLAPRLISNEGLAGGWRMVVMEYLRPEDGWKPVHVVDPADWPDAQQAALAALEKGHVAQAAKGGPALVHGDARSSNCLVRRICDSWEVRFVDFDFAGEEGVHTYRAPLNTEQIQYHPDAAYGRPLHSSHDVYLLNRGHGLTAARLGWSVGSAVFGSGATVRTACSLSLAALRTQQVLPELGLRTAVTAALAVASPLAAGVHGSRLPAALVAAAARQGGPVGPVRALPAAGLCGQQVLALAELATAAATAVVAAVHSSGAPSLGTAQVLMKPSLSTSHQQQHLFKLLALPPRFTLPAQPCGSKLILQAWRLSPGRNRAAAAAVTGMAAVAGSTHATMKARAALLLAAVTGIQRQ